MAQHLFACGVCNLLDARLPCSQCAQHFHKACIDSCFSFVAETEFICDRCAPAAFLSDFDYLTNAREMVPILPHLDNTAILAQLNARFMPIPLQIIGDGLCGPRALLLVSNLCQFIAHASKMRLQGIPLPPLPAHTTPAQAWAALVGANAELGPSICNTEFVSRFAGLLCGMSALSADDLEFAKDKSLSDAHKFLANAGHNFTQDSSDAALIRWPNLSAEAAEALSIILPRRAEQQTAADFLAYLRANFFGLGQYAEAAVLAIASYALSINVSGLDSVADRMDVPLWSTTPAFSQPSISNKFLRDKVRCDGRRFVFTDEVNPEDVLRALVLLHTHPDDRHRAHFDLASAPALIMVYTAALGIELSEDQLCQLALLEKLPSFIRPPPPPEQMPAWIHHNTLAAQLMSVSAEGLDPVFEGLKNFAPLAGSENTAQNAKDTVQRMTQNCEISLPAMFLIVAELGPFLRSTRDILQLNAARANVFPYSLISIFIDVQKPPQRADALTVMFEAFVSHCERKLTESGLPIADLVQTWRAQHKPPAPARLPVVQTDPAPPASTLLAAAPAAARSLVQSQVQERGGHSQQQSPTLSLLPPEVLRNLSHSFAAAAAHVCATRKTTSGPWDIILSSCEAVQKDMKNALQLVEAASPSSKSDSLVGYLSTICAAAITVGQAADQARSESASEPPETVSLCARDAMLSSRIAFRCLADAADKIQSTSARKVKSAQRGAVQGSRKKPPAAQVAAQATGATVAAVRPLQPPLPPEAGQSPAPKRQYLAPTDTEMAAYANTGRKIRAQARATVQKNGSAGKDDLRFVVINGAIKILHEAAVNPAAAVPATRPVGPDAGFFVGDATFAVYAALRGQNWSSGAFFGVTNPGLTDIMQRYHVSDHDLIQKHLVDIIINIGGLSISAANGAGLDEAEKKRKKSTEHAAAAQQQPWDGADTANVMSQAVKINILMNDACFAYRVVNRVSDAGLKIPVLQRWESICAAATALPSSFVAKTPGLLDKAPSNAAADEQVLSPAVAETIRNCIAFGEEALRQAADLREILQQEIATLIPMWRARVANDNSRAVTAAAALLATWQTSVAGDTTALPKKCTQTGRIVCLGSIALGTHGLNEFQNVKKIHVQPSLNRAWDDSDHALAQFCRKLYVGAVHTAVKTDDTFWDAVADVTRKVLGEPLLVGAHVEEARLLVAKPHLNHESFADMSDSAICLFLQASTAAICQRIRGRIFYVAAGSVAVNRTHQVRLFNRMESLGPSCTDSECRNAFHIIYINFDRAQASAGNASVVVFHSTALPRTLHVPLVDSNRLYLIGHPFGSQELKKFMTTALARPAQGAQYVAAENIPINRNIRAPMWRLDRSGNDDKSQWHDGNEIDYSQGTTSSATTTNTNSSNNATNNSTSSCADDDDWTQDQLWRWAYTNLQRGAITCLLESMACAKRAFAKHVHGEPEKWSAAVAVDEFKTICDRLAAFFGHCSKSLASSGPARAPWAEFSAQNQQKARTARDHAVDSLRNDIASYSAANGEGKQRLRDDITRRFEAEMRDFDLAVEVVGSVVTMNLLAESVKHANALVTETGETVSRACNLQPNNTAFAAVAAVLTTQCAEMAAVLSQTAHIENALQAIAGTPPGLTSAAAAAARALCKQTVAIAKIASTIVTGAITHGVDATAYIQSVAKLYPDHVVMERAGAFAINFGCKRPWMVAFLKNDRAVDALRAVKGAIPDDLTTWFSSLCAAVRKGNLLRNHGRHKTQSALAPTSPNYGDENDDDVDDIDAVDPAKSTTASGASESSRHNSGADDSDDHDDNEPADEEPRKSLPTSPIYDLDPVVFLALSELYSAAPEDHQLADILQFVKSSKDEMVEKQELLLRFVTNASRPGGKNTYPTENTVNFHQRVNHLFDAAVRPPDDKTSLLDRTNAIRAYFDGPNVFARQYTSRTNWFTRILLSEIESGVTHCYNLFVEAANFLPSNTPWVGWAQADIRSLVRKMAVDFNQLLVQRMEPMQSSRRARPAPDGGSYPPRTTLSNSVLDSVVASLAFAIESLRSNYTAKGKAFKGRLHPRKSSPIIVPAAEFNRMNTSLVLSRVHLARQLNCGLLNIPIAASAVTITLLPLGCGDDIALRFMPDVVAATQTLRTKTQARHLQLLSIPGLRFMPALQDIDQGHDPPDQVQQLARFVLKNPSPGAVGQSFVVCDPGLVNPYTCILYPSGRRLTLGVTDAASGQQFRPQLHGHQQRIDKLAAAWAKTRGTPSETACKAALAAARQDLRSFVDTWQRHVAAEMLAAGDVIVMPDFKTSQMLARKPGGGRALDSANARDMADMAFARFRLLLRSMIRYLPGKIYLDSQEPYSSQTCRNCGALNAIGGSRTYHCKECSYTSDRDENGAWNILTLATLTAKRTYENALNQAEGTHAAAPTHLQTKLAGRSISKAKRLQQPAAYAERAQIVAACAAACAAEAEAAAAAAAATADEAAATAAAAAAAKANDSATMAKTAAASALAAASSATSGKGIKGRTKTTSMALDLTISCASGASTALNEALAAAGCTVRTSADPRRLFDKPTARVKRAHGKTSAPKWLKEEGQKAKAERLAADGGAADQAAAAMVKAARGGRRKGRPAPKMSRGGDANTRPPGPKRSRPAAPAVHTTPSSNPYRTRSATQSSGAAAASAAPSPPPSPSPSPSPPPPPRKKPRRMPASATTHTHEASPMASSMRDSAAIAAAAAPAAAAAQAAASSSATTHVPKNAAAAALLVALPAHPGSVQEFPALL